MTSTPSSRLALRDRGPAATKSEVPGTLSRVMRRAASRGPYAMRQRKHIMPVAAPPVPTGRMMIAVAVASINMNSPKAMPENRDDLAEAHDAHRDEDQENARKRG